MAQSLFITLKNAQPDCQIDVLAPTWSLALLERMSEVAKAIAMPLSHGQFGLLDRIKLGGRLRAEGYDQAIVLPNSWKSALIPYFADIPQVAMRLEQKAGKNNCTIINDSYLSLIHI